MTDIGAKINEIYSLENFASGDTFVHKLHPLVKLFGTLAFIVVTVSFDRYAAARLVPLFLYPFALSALSETPLRFLMKRVLPALPFCLFIGAANLFFERDAAFYLLGIAVSRGMVSFTVIVLRTVLCVAAALLLVAVTPFCELAAQLKRLGIPGIFITVFEMTYRYAGVMFGEAASMRAAYSLRAPGGKGIGLKHAGSFAGVFLLRSFDRAERVYAAMRLRGYTAGSGARVKRAFTAADVIYIASVCSFCVFFRFFDAAGFFGVLFR